MEKPVLLSSSFSSDGAFLLCGYSDGFAVYSTETMKQLFYRKFISGGVGLAEFVDDSNIFLLVGGGDTPFCSPQKVMIWDDEKARFIGEICVNATIINLRVTNKHFVIATRRYLYLYSKITLCKVRVFDIDSESSGAIASNENCVAFTRQDSKELQVVNENGGDLCLPAHRHNICCMYLADNGSFIATASVRGTLIRMFDTRSGVRWQTFRKGYEKGSINLLCISHDQKYVLCVSEKENISVFLINDNVPKRLFLVSPETKPIAFLHLKVEIKAAYMFNDTSIYILTNEEDLQLFEMRSGEFYLRSSVRLSPLF